MARMARMNSRIRFAGSDHGIENRFWMCGLIWLPRPRMKRPLVYSWRSLPITAVDIGFRANATAIPVASSMRSVSSAASVIGRNGSWLVSAVKTPSYPSSSSSLAAAGISSGRAVMTVPSTRIIPPGQRPAEATGDPRSRHTPALLSGYGSGIPAVVVAELGVGVQVVPPRVQVLVHRPPPRAPQPGGYQGHARPPRPPAADVAFPGRPHRRRGPGRPREGPDRDGRGSGSRRPRAQRRGVGDVRR